MTKRVLGLMLVVLFWHGKLFKRILLGKLEHFVEMSEIKSYEEDNIISQSFHSPLPACNIALKQSITQKSLDTR